MLSTEAFLFALVLSGVFNVCAVLVAFVCWQRAQRSAEWAQRCSEWVKENNKRSRALKELGELSIEVTDLRDLYSSLNSTMKKLRSRIGMRELRARQEAEEQVPDPAVDPAGYKRVMRQKLGLVGGKPNGE